MRLLALFVCLSMLFSASARQSLDIFGLDGDSHERSSNWQAADPAPPPCTDTVRAAHLQRLWLGQLKSRHAVACESTFVGGFTAFPAPDGKPLLQAFRPSLLSQHIRLQL